MDMRFPGMSVQDGGKSNAIEWTLDEEVRLALEAGVIAELGVEAVAVWNWSMSEEVSQTGC